MLDIHEIVVEYPTDISRLKDDALRAARTKNTDETSLAYADVLVIANTTLLSMDSGDLQGDIFHDAVLFVRNGRIESVVGSHDAVIPQGAMVLNAEGGTTGVQ